MGDGLLNGSLLLMGETPHECLILRPAKRQFSEHVCGGRRRAVMLWSPWERTKEGASEPFHSPYIAPTLERCACEGSNFNTETRTVLVVVVKRGVCFPYRLIDRVHEDWNGCKRQT